jgi:hypothetical protein
MPTTGKSPKAARFLGTGVASKCLLVMNEPLPVLMENSVQIAWDYLERIGQIDDGPTAGKFLLNAIEHMVRRGERRRLVLSNNAITAYQRRRNHQIP